MSWNDLKEMGGSTERAVNNHYLPARALCLTTLAVSALVLFMCLVQTAILPVFNGLTIQLTLFIGSMCSLCFLGIVLYDTGSTYLTHPHNFDSCSGATSRGGPGYRACAIGVGIAAIIAIFSVWPVLAGFRTIVYHIQPV